MPDGEKKLTFVTKRDANKANQTAGKPDSQANKKTKGTKAPKMCRYMEYDMEDFFKSCIERYLELAPKGTKLRNVATPFIDEGAPQPGDFGSPATAERDAALAEQEGAKELGPIATKCLMKVLYGARMARYDLLRPCCALATVP